MGKYIEYPEYSTLYDIESINQFFVQDPVFQLYLREYEFAHVLFVI